MVYHELISKPEDRVATLDLVAGDVPELCPNDMNRIYDLLRDTDQRPVRSAHSIQKETDIHYSHVVEALQDKAIARRLEIDGAKNQAFYAAAGSEKTLAEMTGREKRIQRMRALRNWLL